VKLSPTQLRVLRYASEGRLRQKADGRYVIQDVGLLGFEEISAATTLRWEGLIEWKWQSRRRRRHGHRVSLRAQAEVTPTGQALLDATSQGTIKSYQSDSSGALLDEAGE